MDGIDIARRTTGVNFLSGEAHILLWAPEAENAAIRLENGGILELQSAAQGYWQLSTEDLKPGDKYKFIIGDKELPDPASLAQPDGVHGWSQALDIADYAWSDAGWKCPPLRDQIIYELHTGTFSENGDFASVEQRLAHLKELGITAIELMPLAAFPGNRNWGYDGVYPFAVLHDYGGAQGLMHLVDACHKQGLAVIVDVVYNHLGPEGNYLGEYGPYFTDKYQTPWGKAINFDDACCDGVRRFFIENALMWFRDLHVDALRLDAVHAIKDLSPVHILEDIRKHTDELVKLTGRQHYLIVETDLNDPRFIDPRSERGYGMDAQWMDEFHHALRVTAGNHRHGYYADFDGIEHLAKSYKDAYVYDGIYSPHRKKTFGLKTSNPGGQFIVFSQNHDQVGNRMLGERTSTLVSFEMQKLLAAAVLVAPFVPMLFMGEEYAEPAPFLYFTSHTDPELAEAVRKGRKAEFEAFHAEGEAPDPQSEETFLRSKLQWDLVAKEPHSTMLRYYKELIALRKREPALSIPDRNGIDVSYDKAKQTLTLRRSQATQAIFCLMNFSREQRTGHLEYPTCDKIWDSAAVEWLGPGSAQPDTKSGRDIVMQPESILIYTSRHV